MIQQTKDLAIQLQERLIQAIDGLREGAPQAWNALATDFANYHAAGAIGAAVVAVLGCLGVWIAHKFIGVAAGASADEDAQMIAYVGALVIGLMSLAGLLVSIPYGIEELQAVMGPNYAMVKELAGK